MEYGCIGKKLPHSFSKIIHEKIGDYSYKLVELSEEELPKFMENRDFKAINVTIPYKEAASRQPTIFNLKSNTMKKHSAKSVIMTFKHVIVGNGSPRLLV